MRQKTRERPMTAAEMKRLFADVNDCALLQLESLCNRWLTGTRRGREFVALNPTRSDRRPGSFLINLNRGVWADFATGDRGSDPVSLYAYLNGMSQFTAARALAVELGVRS